jgi:transcription-repair coupling factor (superfamily II helicase)
MADLDTRLAFYMRLARVSSSGELDEMEAELEDRFGPLPNQIKNLLYMVRIKLMASGSGVREIITDKGQIVIKVVPGLRIDKLSMQGYFGDWLKVGTSQLRLDLKQAGKQWKRVLEDIIGRMAGAIDG